jgi:hypothetical protein
MTSLRVGGVVSFLVAAEKKRPMAGIFAARVGRRGATLCAGL